MSVCVILQAKLIALQASQFIYNSVGTVSRVHHPEKPSSLDFKDTTAPRFGHSDVVFDPLINFCI